MGQIKAWFVSGWEGEKEAGKHENMGVAKRKERGNSVQKGIQGQMR